MNEQNRSSIFTMYDISKKLPSLPQVLLQTMDICSDPRSTFAQLNAVVSRDPGLTARILSIVNTPAYGMREKVDNLERALLLTGMDVIHNLALCASIYGVFNSDQRFSSRLVLDFWRHSLLTAIYALRVSQKVNFPNPDQAYLGGLLHDIGKLVLLTLSPNYQQLWKAANMQPELRLVLEKEAGLLHTEAGGQLIRRWNLSDDLARAVESHHKSATDLRFSPLLHRILFAANQMAHDCEHASELITSILPLSAADCQNLCRGGVEEARQAAEKLGIPFCNGDPAKKKERPAEKPDAFETMRKEVRTYALLVGSLQSFLSSHSRPMLYKTLEQSFSVLFNLKSFIFLEYDEQLQLLFPWAEGFGRDLPENFRIPLSEKSSLAATALKADRLMTPLDVRNGDLPSSPDCHLLRILGGEGLFAFRSAYKDTPLGVLIMGLPANSFLALKRKEKLLRLILGQFAASLSTHVCKERHHREKRKAVAQSCRQLAVRVTHEIQNPLMLVKNYLHNLSDNEGEVQTLSEELDRVSRLVDRLSHLSEYGEIDYVEKISINGTIKKLAPLIVPAIKLEFDDALPESTLNVDAFRQILINLLNNASEAAGEAQDISIRTRFLNAGGANKQGTPVGYTRGYVEITVHNGGALIPKNEQERIFEAFYTRDKGADHQGLGLAVVQSLTEALGGSVHCDSQAEKGTNFVLTLPLVERY